MDIHLDWKGSRLRLEIADNGCGISREKRQRTGMGLRIMQYRSRSLGGVLAIQSELNRGTRVVCLVPVNFADAPNARQSTVVHVLPGRKAGPEAFGLKAAPRRE